MIYLCRMCVQISMFLMLVLALGLLLKGGIGDLFDYSRGTGVKQDSGGARYFRGFRREAGAKQSSPRKQSFAPPFDGRFGCLSAAGEDCWAGVYVDARTNEVLHLLPGGRALRSPGTRITDSFSQCLWWTAKADVLHMIDCSGQLFAWPGVGKNLRREAQQPGKLAGFYVESNETSVPFAPAHSVHLARDPFGFVFKGSVYSLKLPLRARSFSVPPGGNQYLVVFHGNGVVADIEDGSRVATWSFSTRSPLPSGLRERWATGDTLVVQFKGSYQAGETYGAGDHAMQLDIVLSSSDGGRTWLPVQMHDQGPEDSEVILSLERPTAVSMFPQSSGLASTMSYLNGDDSLSLISEENELLGPQSMQLARIAGVFQVQPTFTSGRSDVGEGFPGLIVISPALPKPTEKRSDLMCVFNGNGARAVWLSWSMALCSIRNLTTEPVTLYLAFKARRITLNYEFLHFTPPRHVRLAWPSTESFMEHHEPSRAAYFAPDVGGGETRHSREAPLDASLAVCAMFKNEAPYLEEWLQYHKLLGVSKVYMYDNNSSDQSRAILRKHEQSGLVLVRDWPHEGGQTEALNDCLCRYRHAARWMAFIDVDEFIEPSPGLPIHIAGKVTRGYIGSDGAVAELDVSYMAARRMLLTKLMEELTPDRHTHCMPWVNYCSSGQRSKPPGGVLENFLEVEDMGERKIHMQKPLFKTMEALTLRKIGPHFLLYATEDIDAQYSRNLRCPYDWLEPTTLHIRHYRSKSLMEYVSRRVGADSAYPNKRYTKAELTTEWRNTNARCKQQGLL